MLYKARAYFYLLRPKLNRSATWKWYTRNCWHISPAKTPINMCICVVWSVLVVRMKKTCILDYIQSTPAGPGYDLLMQEANWPWTCINNLVHVIWLALSLMWAWHLYLFNMASVNGQSYLWLQHVLCSLRHSFYLGLQADFWLHVPLIFSLYITYIYANVLKSIDFVCFKFKA